MIAMLSSSLHIVLAVAMVVLAGAAAWLMLEAFGGRVPKERSRARATLHRGLGRTFALIYLVMLFSMAKMAVEHVALGPVEALHATCGILILPLLVLKVLVIRRWEPFQRFLPVLGSAVFALTFVTVALGLLATHTSRIGEPSVVSPAALPDHPGRQPFERHCAQCHALSRPLNLAARQSPTAAEWTSLVGIMRDRAASRGRNVWSEADGAQIVEFLVAVGQGNAMAPRNAGAREGEIEDEDDDGGRGRGRGRGGR
jgi:mono/diheme cytochrome c family protein